MALEPEEYVHVYLHIARAMYEQQVTIIVAAEICHYAAQPTTDAELHDIIDEVKAELYDWLPSDLAALKECTVMCLVGPDSDGVKRCAQLASMATEGGWNGGLIHASRVNINDVMDMVCKRYLPDDVDVTGMYCASGNIEFGTAEQFKRNVEREVDRFREELDRLFPSNEEGG